MATITTNKVRKRPKKFTTQTHKCSVCSKKFTEKAGLDQHIQTHSLERPFVCNICTSSFKTKKYLSRHIKKVHNPATDHECSFCGKKFHYECLLKRHMYTHTDERPYKCKVCGKGFNSKFTLKSHSYIHTDTKPFKCEFCDYACRDYSTLRKHQERHMGIMKRYQCTLCDKSFTAKSRLRVHVTEDHFEINVYNWKCDKCSKVFKSNQVLKSHVKIVHERAYTCKCEICDAIITNKYNMSRHMSRHVNLRPYICNFNHCAKRFKDKCSLKKHIFLHYPEKHLECEICNKKFSRSNRLKLHLNQHKAKKKCVFCDYCGTSFYNKNYLIKHISQKHLYKMKFVCDKCGFESSSKPGLVNHIKSGHESELDRTCKICNKIYKKHTYLKAHYWKTHCVRYNMTTRRTKLKKRGVIIKEEPIEYIEREFLSEVKIEVRSDTEEKTTDWKTNLNKYFTEQIIKPGSSIIKEKRDNNIKVDVKCQKEAKIYLKKLLEKKRRRRQMNELEKLRKEYNRRLKKLSKSKVITKIRFVRNNNNDKIESNDNVVHSNDEITNLHNDENNKTDDNIIEKKYENNEKDSRYNENESNANNLGDVTEENHQNIHSSNYNTKVNDKNIKNDSNNKNKDVLGIFLNENEHNNEIDYNIEEEAIKQDSKLKINTHQCYVCFKLYETKEKLIRHCQEHFDICNINKLNKCPLCEYVTKGDLKRHMLAVHRINLKTWLKLKKNSTKFDNTDDNINIKIIPSVKSLNKQAYVKLDKLEKKKKERGLIKKSLVKQNGEWIIKNEIDTDYKKYILPKDIINENKCKIIMASRDYLDRLKMLYRVVKENDGKMLFPCEKCEKICQTLSALKLHMRKHDMNPRPFKKKIWKHKLIRENREKQRETGENEYENAEKQIHIVKNRYKNPKPIGNKHKCDNELKEFYDNNIKGGDIEFWHFLKIFNKMSKENVNDAPESMGIIEIGKKETGKLLERGSFNRSTKDVKKGINRRILISKKEYERRKLVIERLRKKNIENSF